MTHFKSFVIATTAMLHFSWWCAAETCTITTATTFQTIRGFGGSSAWTSPLSILVDRADLLYDVNTGIGLSLLRNRIASSVNTTVSSAEVAMMRAAKDRNVAIWSAAWSPPAAMKTNDSVVNGGSLKESSYVDFANKLADYVQILQDSGITLFAVSPFNEPDLTTTYESSTMSGRQIHDFIARAGAVFTERKLVTRFLIPETVTIADCAGHANETLDDSVTARYVYAVATHIYAFDSTTMIPYQKAIDRGKELWVTEMCDAGKPQFETPYDSTMVSGLRTAGWIHYALAKANASVFHFWWLAHNVTNNGLMQISSTDLPKRFWVMGNYSRFVRPGFVRIGCPHEPTPGVYTSAYKNDSGTVVIVAVNRMESPIEQQFSVPGCTAAGFFPWVTSPADNLQRKEGVTLIGGLFSYVLPAQSVVTFVAAASLGVKLPPHCLHRGGLPETGTFLLYAIDGRCIGSVAGKEGMKNLVSSKHGCYIVRSSDKEQPFTKLLMVK